MRDEAAARDVTERMAMMMAEWGFPRMPARVLMAVMADDAEVLTAGEIGERLSVSPAAVSGAVRYLIHLRMLEKVPLPKSRRDGYRIPEDAWYEGTAIKTDIYRAAAQMSGEAAKALGEESPAGRRMVVMREYFEFIEDQFPRILQLWKERKTTLDAQTQEPPA
ncbi:MarR family transcriptional regulator [Streptosporangiaceae bacterium NEAU-GS5]|nr:MarR family transcriptional regulator [Streptosporangiaceae bacterium NEAU-GS5]